jgi:hypothetical protein
MMLSVVKMIAYLKATRYRRLAAKLRERRSSGGI